jgi:uncharacterized Ntn-hydrolase superfamily protein
MSQEKARQIVNDHFAVYGHIPHEDKLVEAIAAALPRCDAVTEEQVLRALEAAGLAWGGTISARGDKVVPSKAVMTFARALASEGRK